MNYKLVVNTAVRYFEILGDFIAKYRRESIDKVVPLEAVNKHFDRYTLTQSGLNAHIWVKDVLKDILDLYDKGGNPRGYEIQRLFKKISLDGYYEHLRQKSITAANKRWQEHLRVAMESDNEDDIIFINRKLMGLARLIEWDAKLTLKELESDADHQRYLDRVVGIYDPDKLSEKFRY